jgi:hypothetical protein
VSALAVALGGANVLRAPGRRTLTVSALSLRR